MFARVAQVHIKPERREELLTLAHNEFQPLVKAQPGFVDTVALISEIQPNTVLTVSFWRSHDDAQRFLASKQYGAWMQKVLPLLTGEPAITNYTVDTSTFHHIARGKAA